MHARAARVFLRLAIGFARMVDPASVIAMIAAVNDLARACREKEGMKRIVWIRGMQGIGLLRGDSLARILDNPGAGRNVSGGEYTVAVQSGSPDCMPGWSRFRHGSILRCRAQTNNIVE